MTLVKDDVQEQILAAAEERFCRYGFGMGGDVSHEFLVPAAIGEDEIVICDKCGFASSASDDQKEKEYNFRA